MGENVQSSTVSQSDIGIYIFLGVCGLLLIISILLGFRKKDAEGAVYGKLKKRSILLSFYQFFSRLFLTRWMVARVRRMYQTHCPMEPSRVNVKTMKVCFWIWGAGIVILYVVFMRNPSVYNLAMAAFFATVLATETVRFVSKAAEKRILRQLEKLLNDVRHHYYDTQSVVSALKEAAQGAGYEMRVHTDRLCDVLSAANIKSAVEDYNQGSANRFLKLFLSQCVATQEYGDTITKGESLFIRNLNDLRADILNYLLQLDRLQFEFGGLTFITVLPILFLPLIRGMALDALPELDSFFSGAIGVLAGPVYLIISVLIYLVIVKMQELDAGESVRPTPVWATLARIPFIERLLLRWEGRNFGRVIRQQERLRKAGERTTPKQFLLKKTAFALAAFAAGIWLFSLSHIREREVILSRVENAGTLSSAATRKQVENMKTTIMEVVGQLKGEGDLTGEIVKRKVMEVSMLSSPVLIDATAKECMVRIEAYRNAFLKWYEVVIVLFISIGAYFIPVLLLIYKESLMKMNMLSEVTTFQSIVMMQMYIPDITVLSVLMSLEQFAVIFRASLQDCVNEFSFSWEDALEGMKEAEKYEPFRRLCDNFLIADKIGMVLAFEEIAQDREHFQKQRELDTAKMIKNKSARARLIAFVPLGVIVATYLILPFAIESINQFSVIMRELGNM